MKVVGLQRPFEIETSLNVIISNEYCIVVIVVMMILVILFKPTIKLYRSYYITELLCQCLYSGLPSERINLSPFTKDFRGGGHIMSIE